MPNIDPTIFFIAIALALFAGMSIALIGPAEDAIQHGREKMDKGLFHCKLGENYVWLNKDEVLKLFFTDRSE